MGSEHNAPPAQDWLERLKARGWAGPLAALLDALEPIAPLAAQLCYLAEPAAWIVGGREPLREVAQSLETPGGIEALRQRLCEP